MMKKYVLLTAVVGLLACSVMPRTSRPGYESAEEYAVYSALIAHMFAGDAVTFENI